MSIPETKNQLTLTEERSLLDYLDALRRGDLDTQQAILNAYTSNPAFELAVWEVQVAVGEETLHSDATATVASAVAEDSRLLDLIARTLHRPVARTRAEIEAEAARQYSADLAALEEEDGSELLDPSPLTLRDVTVRLREDLSAGLIAARNRGAARAAVLHLEASGVASPLSDDTLTPRGTRNLLHQLGLGAVGEWLERLFHDAVIDLSQQREQEMFRLAAARRRNGKKRGDASGNEKGAGL